MELTFSQIAYVVVLLCIAGLFLLAMFDMFFPPRDK